MELHKTVGHAGLIGWREKVANVVAPRADLDENARAIIGGAFFVLSVLRDPDDHLRRERTRPGPPGACWRSGRRCS